MPRRTLQAGGGGSPLPGVLVRAAARPPVPHNHEMLGAHVNLAGMDGSPAL